MDPATNFNEPLRKACENEQQKTIQLLLKDTRIYEKTVGLCLQTMTERGNDKIVQSLLEHTQDIPGFLITELTLKAKHYHMPQLQSTLSQYQPKQYSHPKNVMIFLAGTQGGPITRQQLLKYANAITVNSERYDTHVTSVGTCKREWNRSDIELLEEYITLYRQSKITVFIFSHGGNEKGELVLSLNDEGITASELFSKVSARLNGRSIDIFSMACHSGAFHERSLQLLPPKSTYVSTSYADEFSLAGYIDSMINALETTKNLKNCVSAQCLFLSYLTQQIPEDWHHLGNEMPRPLIATEDFSIPPAEVLKHLMGRPFLEKEKNKIFKYLNEFLSFDNLNKTITMIEEAIEPVAQTRLERDPFALAIAYVIARDESYLQELHKELLHYNTSRFFQQCDSKPAMNASNFKKLKF